MAERFFDSLVLALHLLSVDVAMIGPLLMIWLEARARKGDAAAQDLLPKVGFISVKALIVGGAFGALYGWSLWSEDYQATILSTGSRWKFTLIEYAFSFVLILLAWITAKRAFRKLASAPVDQRRTSLGGFLLRAFLLFAAATNLIYHFPVYFEVLAVLRHQPLRTEPLTSADFRAFLFNPTVLSRSLHVILASIAATGAMVAWMAGRRVARAEESERGAWMSWYRKGLLAVVGATSLQFFVGFWVALTLRRDVAIKLAGGTDEGLIIIGLAAAAITGLMQTSVIGLLEKNRATHGGLAVLWLSAAVWAMCWISVMTR